MPLADAGGILTWLEFDGSTRNNFIEGLTTALLMAGWALTDEIFSSITGTYASNPSNGQTISAGNQVYTFVTALTSTPSQVLIGASLAASLSNLVAAVNLGAGSGVTYSATTPLNATVEASTSGSDITFTFRYPGPMGNSTPTSFGITTGGGFKVIGQTPQLEAGSAAQMSSKAWLYDRGLSAGSKLFANAQALSPDETLASNERTILVAGGRTFRCVANQSQFFCYVPGTAADPNGSVLAGGTLWVAPSNACAGDVPQAPASLAFWSVGDSDDFLVNPQTTPRTVVTGIASAHFTDTDMAGAQVTQSAGDANGYHSSDACFNSAVTLGAGLDDNQYGGFQLVSLQPPFNYTLPSSTSLIDAMRWFGANGIVGKRMLIEPLVAWAPPGGGSGSSPAQVIGQLWNAWIGTDQVPMDTVQQFDDGNFYLAFTHQGKFGTLWLETPGPAPLVLTAVSYAH